MFRSILFCALLFFFTEKLLQEVKADDDCLNSKQHLAPVRLKNHLLCDYDMTLRPVRNHNNATNVTVQLILKYFQYDMEVSVLTLDTWIAMFWKDEHLTWTPSDYESISSIHLSTDDIWMPDLSVYNRESQEGKPSVVDYATCTISWYGTVVCVPPARITGLCVADLTKYPFDTQNCTVRLGSWIHSGEEVNYKLSASPVTTEDLEHNGEWDLVETKVFRYPGHYECCPNSTFPSLNFSFSIKRMVSAHSASVIFPAIVIIIMTLTSLAMSASRPDRLILCNVNIICQFMYLQYISWMIPLKGRNTPLLLLFARDSLLLCVFTIVFTVFLGSIERCNKIMSSQISTVLNWCVSCKVGQWILLDDEKKLAEVNQDEDGKPIIIVGNVENTPQNSTEWLVLSKILDRILFIIYCIVYFTMFISFTP